MLHKSIPNTTIMYKLVKAFFYQTDHTTDRKKKTSTHQFPTSNITVTIFQTA